MDQTQVDQQLHLTIYSGMQIQMELRGLIYREMMEV